MPSLANPRHERFAQELAKGKPASDAYVEAGYKPNRGNASTLANEQSISKRVAELQDRAAIRTEITVEKITAMLIEDRDFARQQGQSAAAVSATEKLGKLHGLFVDKAETVNIHYDVSDSPGPTEDEWEAEHPPH